MTSDHFFFIALSYGITAVAVLGMVAAIVLDYRRLKKSLVAMGVTVAARDERTDLD